MERYNFNKRNQQDGGPFVAYVTKLRELMNSCHFCVLCQDGLLRDRIVEGIQHAPTRKQLLAIKKLDLKTTLEICKAEGASNREVDVIESVCGQQINLVRKQKQRSKPDKITDEETTARPDNPTINSGHGDVNCGFCCRSHKRGRKNCPAYGKKM